MSKTKEPEFVAKTLAWCNERRAEKGKRALKKLPKGYRSDGRSCPCGKATGLFVNHSYYHPVGFGHLDLRTPVSVGKFVEAFDGGELPQYELKG